METVHTFSLTKYGGPAENNSLSVLKQNLIKREN